MHKSRLGGLIIDCRTDDLGKAAEFWSGALGLATLPNSPDDPKNTSSPTVTRCMARS